jgi:sulfate adenylyltransferase subunit 2
MWTRRGSFRDVLAFRDAFAAANGFRLEIFANEEGRRDGINPFQHGDTYTLMMRTQALKMALDAGGYDIIFGGARRDEEVTRAKERVVSVREPGHGWAPRNQRPEFGQLYNWRLGPGQTIRAFPLSNWTEHDLWTYIAWRNIALCPLYFAARRQVVSRDGMFIVIDEPERMRWRDNEQSRTEWVRFRTLGCWPVTAAIASEAESLPRVVMETLRSRQSERQGRVSDGRSLERHKREGYF